MGSFAAYDLGKAACYVAAGGHDSSALVNQTGHLTLGYHNLTIWYFQRTYQAGLVLGGAISPYTSWQVCSAMEAAERSCAQSKYKYSLFGVSL